MPARSWRGPEYTSGSSSSSSSSSKKKNGEISCIERVPARDGWLASSRHKDATYASRWIPSVGFVLGASAHLTWWDGLSGRLKIRGNKSAQWVAGQGRTSLVTLVTSCFAFLYFMCTPRVWIACTPLSRWRDSPTMDRRIMCRASPRAWRELSRGCPGYWTLLDEFDLWDATTLEGLITCTLRDQTSLSRCNTWWIE